VRTQEALLGHRGLPEKRETMISPFVYHRYSRTGYAAILLEEPLALFRGTGLKITGERRYIGIEGITAIDKSCFTSPDLETHHCSSTQMVGVLHILIEVHRRLLLIARVGMTVLRQAGSFVHLWRSYSPEACET
jgi:hypothetical protein